MLGGSGMNEFWIVLVVALLIFVVSRVGDLGTILSNRLKNTKNAAKADRGGQEKS